MQTSPVICFIAFSGKDDALMNCGLAAQKGLQEFP